MHIRYYLINFVVKTKFWLSLTLANVSPAHVKRHEQRNSREVLTIPKRMEKEFEDYWKLHSKQLEKVAPEQLRNELEDFGKMNTAGDWLLFIVPFIVFILFFDQGFIANQVINFIVGMVLAGLSYVVTVMIKPYVTRKRDINDIQADIKEYFHQLYLQGGLQALRKKLNG